MFTGIVEEKGQIQSIKKEETRYQLEINAPRILSNIKQGDSISVNGICLTVTSFNHQIFTADVMQETLSRTSLYTLEEGSYVNLERAMQVNDRFGGHIVSGHIDGTGTIVAVTKDDIAYWYTIDMPKDLMKYVIEKGSITLDGISLTVADVDEEQLKVSIIPHTLNETNLSQKTEGDKVNIEVDMIAKYVEKLSV